MENRGHSDIICCQAYRDIVDMGRDILPLLTELYDKFGDDSDIPILLIKSYGFPKVISSLVYPEHFAIPKELDIYRDREEYIVSWLERYRKRMRESKVISHL